jgi:hypothetical protein
MSWIGGISMLRRIRGIRKIPINLPWYWQKSFNIFVYASKGQSTKIVGQG